MWFVGSFVYESGFRLRGVVLMVDVCGVAFVGSFMLYVLFGWFNLDLRWRLCGGNVF